MTSRLIQLFNGEEQATVDLTRESLIIGRRPDSDIVLDNLAVSGAHARVLTILSDSFVEDLDSTNGTFVNGERIRKHALKNGDVITVGKHQFRFEGDDASEDAFSETMIVSADGGATDQGGAEIREQPKQGLARLRVITPDGPGRELPLNKALTTLGKPGVQVAAISRRAQGDFIVHVDGGPDNQKVPVVNGTPIGLKSCLLRHQDVIEIAGVKMEYLKA